MSCSIIKCIYKEIEIIKKKIEKIEIDQNCCLNNVQDNTYLTESTRINLGLPGVNSKYVNSNGDLVEWYLPTIGSGLVLYDKQDIGVSKYFIDPRSFSNLSPFQNIQQGKVMTVIENPDIGVPTPYYFITTAPGARNNINSMNSNPTTYENSNHQKGITHWDIRSMVNITEYGWSNNVINVQPGWSLMDVYDKFTVDSLIEYVGGHITKPNKKKKTKKKQIDRYKLQFVIPVYITRDGLKNLIIKKDFNGANKLSMAIAMAEEALNWSKTSGKFLVNKYIQFPKASDLFLPIKEKDTGFYDGYFRNTDYTTEEETKLFLNNVEMVGVITNDLLKYNTLLSPDKLNQKLPNAVEMTDAYNNIMKYVDKIPDDVFKTAIEDDLTNDTSIPESGEYAVDTFVANYDGDDTTPQGTGTMSNPVKLNENNVNNYKISSINSEIGRDSNPNDENKKRKSLIKIYLRVTSKYRINN